jgi:hypothetical protein
MIILLKINKITKIKVAEVLIEANKFLKQGEEVYFQGPTTGIFRQKIVSMEKEHRKIKKAGQGERVAIAVQKKVRAGDEVYKVGKGKVE